MSGRSGAIVDRYNSVDPALGSESAENRALSPAARLFARPSRNPTASLPPPPRQGPEVT